MTSYFKMSIIIFEMVIDHDRNNYYNNDDYNNK